MCGISGILDLREPVPGSLISAMNEYLGHRGPDDCGIYVGDSGRIGLGHRRLAIIDLSSNGHQPMSTPDGRFTIVFNGEIYNYVEVRAELEKIGVRMNSDSDTEVLLRAYELWGMDAISKFLGMFAFAIWDRDEEKLVLVRDRLGKKPLLYFWDGRKFAFASELKALLAVPGCRATLDPDAVKTYLAFGYVPAPYAIFANIWKLQPGHWLTLHRGQISTIRYWFPEQTALRPAATEMERTEQLRELFQDSVRIRLRADVPIALFLSGGIDSSVVAAECARQGQTLHAFTVAFDHDRTDLPHASRVARALGLEHEVLETSARNLRDDLHQIVWHYDEPFADTSSIPCYYIARAAAGRFKVVLNGDGGDECFAGYRHYHHIAFKQAVKNLAAAASISDGSFARPWQVYFQSKALFRQSERDRLLLSKGGRDSVTELIDRDPFLNACVPLDALHRALWADRHIYLSNDLLYKMDIALMASGIEGRSPFLDHRLMEWAQKLPNSELIRGTSKKLILRRAFASMLPADVLTRSKHGFGAPVVRWLQHELRDTVREFLPTRLLDESIQRSALAAFNRRPESNAGRLWALLMFAVWADRWNVTW